MGACCANRSDIKINTNKDSIPKRSVNIINSNNNISINIMDGSKVNIKDIDNCKNDVLKDENFDNYFENKLSDLESINQRDKAIGMMKKKSSVKFQNNNSLNENKKISFQLLNSTILETTSNNCKHNDSSQQFAKAIETSNSKNNTFNYSQQQNNELIQSQAFGQSNLLDKLRLQQLEKENILSTQNSLSNKKSRNLVTDKILLQVNNQNYNFTSYNSEMGNEIKRSKTYEKDKFSKLFTNSDGLSSKDESILPVYKIPTMIDSNNVSIYSKFRNNKNLFDKKFTFNNSNSLKESQDKTSFRGRVSIDTIEKNREEDNKPESEDENFIYKVQKTIIESGDENDADVNEISKINQNIINNNQLNQQNKLVVNSAKNSMVLTNQTNNSVTSSNIHRFKRHKTIYDKLKMNNSIKSIHSIHSIDSFRNEKSMKISKEEAEIIKSQLMLNNHKKNSTLIEHSKGEIEDDEISKFTKSKNIYKTHKIKAKESDKFSIDPKIEKTNGNYKDYYDIESKLGSGSYGTVFKVKHKKLNLTRAIKVIKKEDTSISSFIKEIEILKSISNLNIIKIYEYYEDDVYYYIIMEYIKGLDLYSNISMWDVLNEKMIKIIFYQVISAVSFMHQKGIIHRDIKPENILLEEISEENRLDIANFYKNVNVKIIDFGTSNFYDKKKKLNEIVGSPYYIAPEVLTGEYNEKCDIWSCGVLLYVMLIGNTPFDADTRNELLFKIVNQEIDYSDENWENISSKAKNLVKKMLDRNPDTRYSAEDVRKHPWMTDVETLKSITISNNSNNFEENNYKVNALNGIKNFVKQDKLQQATIAYLTYFLSPSEEFIKMKSLFSELDKNLDGTLSKQEISSGFESIFGKTAMGIDIETLLESMDSNGDGVISYEEFFRVVISKTSLLNEKNLQVCFENFDTNGDGKLNADEIKKALGSQSNDYVKSLIQLIDQNSNEEIDFDEFKMLMEVIVKRERGDIIPSSNNTSIAAQNIKK